MKLSHKQSSRKKELSLCIFMGLGVAILVASTLILYVSFSNKEEDESRYMATILASNHKQKVVCICLADDRYSLQDLQMANVKTSQELVDFVRTHHGETLSNLGYWQKTAVINIAYALKFGHKVIMSNLTAYRDVYKEQPRPSVWSKPAFMLDVQHSRLDCDWFASIDSDAYLWMSKHTVDLISWFSTASLHEASFGYYEFEREKRRRKGFYDWDEQKAFFLVGLNGVFSNPPEGFPNPFEDRDNDFICAGVYFIKNDPRSKQFLHDWVSGPTDSSPLEKAIIQEYTVKFSLEQRVLNMVLYPRFKAGMHIYSYRDFGSKGGPMIRHTWSQFYQERDTLMSRDLVDLGFGKGG